MSQKAGHLLVVDDNEVNRMVLARSLERQGHHVVPAWNGREALELLRTSSFDLVLLDIEMPEMDGYQVLAAMKQDTQLRHIPVIMVTAVDEIESAIHCIEMGAEDYLPKPFKPALLKARLSSSLEKKHLRDLEQLYLKSMERELDIGREIQQGFLPARLPSVDGWEIAAALMSAREVAGDFYDAFELPDGTLGLVIADVCDKGVGAALFMTLFRSLLRAAANLDYFEQTGHAEASHASTERLRRAIVLTNNYIAETHGDSGMFATIFFGILDPGDGKLIYINGGHESPLIVTRGKVRETLRKTGPAVGALASCKFEILETRLVPGDTLFAFTDGVPDCQNPKGEFFGRERLHEILQTSRSAAETVKAIEVDLRHYISGMNQFDDITLLAVRRPDQPQKNPSVPRSVSESNARKLPHA